MLGCPDGWTHFPHNGHCYKYQSTKLNWNEARSFCQTDAPGKGDLASIHDKATNDFLQTLTTEYSFLGGTDEGSEGVWRWSDGSPWDYENWSPGQPDNAAGRQPYALKYSTGKWDDGYAGANPFICQSTPGIQLEIGKIKKSKQLIMNLNES